MTILRNVNEMTREQLLALVAQMKVQGDRKITCKVTEKGGVSVYGLGRFPVTLYGSQWDKLAANMSGIMQFVEANRSLLSTKD